jgi:Zn-finger nucleic acid-binding protein
MMCPNGHAALQIAERNGVEIDYCPECRGVWLDRGELDKIIDRAEASSGPSRPAEPRRDARPDDRRDDRYDGGRPHTGHPPHKKSKGGWLGEMFDF